MVYIFCMIYELCDEYDPVVRQPAHYHRIQRFNTSAFLQTIFTVMRGVTVKGLDLLTQNCNTVTVVKNCA